MELDTECAIPSIPGKSLSSTPLPTSFPHPLASSSTTAGPQGISTPWPGCSSSRKRSTGPTPRLPRPTCFGLMFSSPSISNPASTKSASERYRKFFIDDDLAAQTMHEDTGRLVALLELGITRQRLDSTHVFSNMACFGRTRLLGVTPEDRILFQSEGLRHEALSSSQYSKIRESSGREIGKGTNIAIGIEGAAPSPSGWVSSSLCVPRALLWAKGSQSVGLKTKACNWTQAASQCRCRVGDFGKLIRRDSLASGYDRTTLLLPAW